MIEQRGATAFRMATSVDDLTPDNLKSYLDHADRMMQQSPHALDLSMFACYCAAVLLLANIAPERVRKAVVKSLVSCREPNCS